MKMASMKSRLDAARAQAIVIGFEPAEHLAVLRDRIQSPFRFVVVRDRVLYRAFDLPRIGAARTYLHPKVLGFYGKMATKGRLPQLRRNQDRRRFGAISCSMQTVCRRVVAPGEGPGGQGTCHLDR